MIIKELKPSNLSEAQKDRMFFLMEKSYDNLDKNIFLLELEDKDITFLLLDKKENIVGFTSVKLFSKKIEGEDIIGVFSGDTVVLERYRGGLELSYAWLNYALNLNDGNKLIFWFMLSKGYKTYRLLPRFFKEFYPHYKIDTPKKIKIIIDNFSFDLFGDRYDSASNIYKPARNYNVKLGKKEINDNLLKDKYIKFFAEKNKNFWMGEELVSYCELSKKNLKFFANLFLFIGRCKIFMFLWRSYIKIKKYL